MRLLLVATICLVLGVVVGAWPERAQRLMVRIVSHLPGLKGVRIDAYEARLQTDLDGRTAVPCPAQAETILVLGQSNAANWVGARFRSERGAVDWLAGHCYPSAGPTLGSEGVAGSIWPLVGDLMLAARPARPIRFVGLALGGTSSREWADPRAIGGLLARRLEELQRHGVRVDQVAWQQGEADWEMPVDRYVDNLRHVIAQVHAAFPAARFHVAQASVCVAPHSRTELVAAQASLVDGAGVRAGPRADDIVAFGDRYDGCHFSAAGAAKLAQAWASSLVADEPVAESRVATPQIMHTAP